MTDYPINWRGNWSFGVQYEPNDMVLNPEDDKTYICVKRSKNYPPQYTFSGFELAAGVDLSTIDGGAF
jgi:hypothetical protein